LLKIVLFFFSAEELNKIGASQGKVKWFNTTRGYGEITDKGTHTDVFVHHSNIIAEGWRCLEVIFYISTIIKSFLNQLILLTRQN
jgi:hypothetical protein